MNHWPTSQSVPGTLDATFLWQSGNSQCQKSDLYVCVNKNPGTICILSTAVDVQNS